MRKIIGVCVVICFFVNNISFALTPALKLGNLGGETYHDKFLYYAEAGLEKSLLELNGLSTAIRGTKDINIVKEAFSKKKGLRKERSYAPEKTVFNSLRVKSFFNLVEHVGGNIFAVPVVVEKKSIGVCENYRLLFSTVYDNKNKGFPVFYCTREEFEKNRSDIVKSNALPTRSKKETERLRESMSRYGAHDGGVDEFIERHTEKGHFTEIESRAKDLLWDKKYKKRYTPGSYLPKKYFDYMKTEIDAFLKYIGADINVDAAFEEKNVVFIKVLDWEKFPEIEEDGKELRVTSHSSENAVYKFLTREKFDLLIAENGLTDETKEILNETIIDFVHEIGVTYNLRWWVYQRDPGSDIRTMVNTLDALYTDYRHDKYGISLESQPVQYVKSKFAKGRRNLDHLFAENNPRDYANAKEPEIEEYERARMLFGKRLAPAMYKADGRMDAIDGLIEDCDEYLKCLWDQDDDTTPGANLGNSLLRIQTGLKKYINMAIVHILTTCGQCFPEAKDLYINPMLFRTITPALHDSKDIAVRQEAISVLQNILTDPDSAFVQILKDVMDDLEAKDIDLSKKLKSGRNEPYLKGLVTHIIEPIADNMLEEYYGTENPACIIHTVESIKEHLLLIKNEKGNLYRQAVEEDIQAARANGKIKKTEIPSEVKKLLNEWRRSDESKTEFKDAVLFQIFKGERSDTYLRTKSYFERLPDVLKNWIAEKYSEILHLNLNDVRNDDFAKMFLSDLNVTMELMLYVTDCLKKATKIDIFQIEGEFYVSPRTKEIAHVRRGIKQTDPDACVYMGSKLHEKLSPGKYKNAFALFLFNEIQHMNNFEVGHRKIETLEDIRVANDHVVIGALREIEYDYVEHDVKPWGELLPGGIVGESERMKAVFQRTLEPFARARSVNTLLIKSAPGAGGTQIAEAVREMMGIEREGKRVIRLSGAKIMAMHEDKIIELFFGKVYKTREIGEMGERSVSERGILKCLVDSARKHGKNAQSLLIIDDLSSIAGSSQKAEIIRGILHLIFEDSKKVGLQNGPELDIKNVKIIGVTNDRNLTGFTLDFRNKFKVEANIPDLGKRGDDIMRIAEKMNFDESKKEFRIQRLMQKSALLLNPGSSSPKAKSRRPILKNLS